jgi:hypothetical protein
MIGTGLGVALSLVEVGGLTAGKKSCDSESRCAVLGSCTVRIFHIEWYIQIQTCSGRPSRRRSERTEGQQQRLVGEYNPAKASKLAPVSHFNQSVKCSNPHDLCRYTSESECTTRCGRFSQSRNLVPVSSSWL